VLYQYFDQDGTLIAKTLPGVYNQTLNKGAPLPSLTPSIIGAMQARGGSTEATAIN